MISRTRFVVIALTLGLFCVITPSSMKFAKASNAPKCEVWVSSLVNGDLSIFDTWSSTSSTLSVSSSTIQGLAFNHSGTKMFATTFGSGVKMIDTSNHSVTDLQINYRTFGDYGAVAASPVSDHMIVGTQNFPVPNPNEFYVLNSETGANVSTINGTNRAARIVMTPDGVAYAPLFVHMANPADGDIQKINVSQGAIISTTQFNLPASESFSGATVATRSDNTSILYVASSDGIVKAINPSTMTLITNINVNAYPGGLASSLDGNRVFVTSYASNTIQIINTQTQQVINTLPFGSGIGQLAVSPDGAYLFASSFTANSLYRINLSNYQVDSFSNFNMATHVAVGPPGCTTTEPPAPTATNAPATTTPNTPSASASATTTIAPTTSSTVVTSTVPNSIGVLATTSDKSREVAFASQQVLPASGGTHFGNIAMALFMLHSGGLLLVAVRSRRRNQSTA